MVNPHAGALEQMVADVRAVDQNDARRGRVGFAEGAKLIDFGKAERAADEGRDPCRANDSRPGVRPGAVDVDVLRMRLERTGDVLDEHVVEIAYEHD
jgi:hypothetical protein